MRNTIKLLPVLLLGSALGGCSMAGLGNYSADQYAQGQQSQYWGASSSACQQLQPQLQQPTACEQAYAPAPQTVPSYAYNAPAQQAYGQAVPQQQVNTGQTVYQGSQGYTGQEIYQGQQANAGYQQGYPTQQGYQQTGYAPAHVNSRGRSSRGLRQAYTYGTLGATLYDVDSDLYGIQGRLGWQSKSIFGAEVEGSFGFTDDDASVDFGAGFVDSEVEIDTQIAAFGVARYPVSQQLNLLGRVGYHNTEFEAESTFNDGITEDEDEFSSDGLAYGVGVEYALGQRTSVRADYTIYDFDGPNGDAISLAIARKF